MSAAKKPPKRSSRLITRLDAFPGEDGGAVTLRVKVSTAEIGSRLLDRLRTERGKGRVRAAMNSLIQPPAKYRPRLGEVQPQIPGRLREALRYKAEAIGARKSNALVLRELEAWTRFAARHLKNRVSGKGGRKLLKPPTNISDFRERGRALIAEGNLVRFTVNLGRGTERRALKKLARFFKMNMSEFFSALIERLCNAGQLHDSVGAAQIPDQSEIDGLSL